ncbi:MAG: 2-oxo acid dehydrogenase subunit E2 [Anaerolineales bacterium]|jgi:pyruvate dehydrogenase E2 component (dihydrolipoamide acetyltransferase)
MPLPYAALFVRVAARALEEHPALNALLVGDEIQMIGQVNMGVAVDAPQGVLVPVGKGPNKKSFRETAEELAGLIDRARTSKLLPEDLLEGTFTITNLGMNEIDAFTPIINPPQIAILGVGRILPKPVAWLGQIRLRDMVFLSLTFDHRAVDGAPAARFLQGIKMLLEDPGWIFP